MICEVYRRRGVLGRRRGWGFRFIYENGRLPGHIYRDPVDAARGAHDFIAAITHGDITFRVADDPEGT